MLNKIIDEYKSGKINSKEYGKKMFEEYESLQEYKDLLKNSMVQKIEITKESVSVDIEKNGKNIKMIIYPTDAAAVPATIMSFGNYESEELDMTLSLLKMIDEKCVVFDVGANLGWYTINILKDNPNRNVYSFEPIEDTYFKLKDNFKINDIKNSELYNIGFYKENKNLKFFYDTTATGASSLADLREVETTKIVECKLKKMDDFVDENNIKRLDFIKCDVEGSELFVYQGGIESIKKFKPIIFSEMLRKWSAKFNYHPNDIIELFRKIDYNCYVIEDNKLKKFNIVDEETVETNYFFLHNEKHKYIINKIVR